MLEKDLRNPVIDWLAFRGMHAVHEAIFCNAYCDLIGFRFAPRTNRRIPRLEWVVAVELKLARIGEVIRQAENNRQQVNASYAAMPDDRCQRMTRKSIRKFTSAGVGLLGVDGNTVLSYISPIVALDGREQANIHRWWRWHKRIAKQTELNRRT